MKTNHLRLLTLGVVILSVFFVALPLLGQTTPHEVLRYAQVANGVSGAGYWQTSILVSNANSFSVTVEFTDHDHYSPLFIINSTAKGCEPEGTVAPRRPLCPTNRQRETSSAALSPVLTEAD